jgi:glycosyltransferase involved in cell wall biosynthesis
MTAPPSPIPAAVAGLAVLAFADWYTPEASGGAERAAWEVYRRLGAAGTKLHVVSAAHGPAHDDPGVAVTAVKGYDLSGIVGGYFAPAPAAFRAGRRLVGAWHPRVLHANTIHYTGCVAAARLRATHGIPLVVTAQLGALDHLPTVTRLGGAAYEHTFGRYVLRHADRVLAVSESVREHVIAIGARPSAITIAPNGVDHSRFGLPPIVGADNPLIISVGRLLENKGSRLLVEAAGILAASGFGFDLAFVGDGPLRGELEERVDQLGIRDRVRFAGQVPDPERWLADAEIVVRASYTEGLSLAVIEAMAAGRCNVVSDIPPNRELIADRDNGFLFRCGDASDLARALRDAISDAALRVRAAAKAQRDSQQYTWDRMAATHADAFVELAATASPR